MERIISTNKLNWNIAINFVPVYVSLDSHMTTDGKICLLALNLHFSWKFLDPDNEATAIIKQSRLNNSHQHLKTFS